MSADDRPLLRIGHSPDPDDAFMWWPLFDEAPGGARIDTGPFRYAPVRDDIETLNERSHAGDLEITAMSCAQYPHVRDTYALTACGASMGDAYGPKLVSCAPMTVDDLRAPDVTVAVPGRRTSAYGLLSLMVGPGTFREAPVPFDRIIDVVVDGTYAAGVVIHEGQLTYERAGLHLIADLGAWWSGRFDLPTPLGVNAIRRDLETRHGPGTLARVTRTLRESVEYALAHRDESIRYALQFARGMASEDADRFVAMYVNAWTLAFGPEGERAVRAFLGALHDAGLVPDPGPVEFIEPLALA